MDSTDELIDIYDADGKLTGKTQPRRGRHLKTGEYMLYVLAIIQNRSGDYLITQRAIDKQWAAGCWEVPGGGAKAGETSAQAVTREVSEEVGLDVSDQDLTPIWSYRNDDPEGADNYLVDIYHFTLDFSENDVTLERSEASDFWIVSNLVIRDLANQEVFLHYDRLKQALENEAAANEHKA